GRHLLAHELVHVVQQAGGSSTALTPASSEIRRAPDQASTEPTAIGFSVTLDGLRLSIPDTITYKPGPKALQILAILLQRLVGDQFKPGLEHEAAAVLSRFPFKRAGGLTATASAKGGEPIGPTIFALQPTLLLIDWLRKVKKLEVQLTEAQEELLTLAVASADLWADFVETLKQ